MILNTGMYQTNFKLNGTSHCVRGTSVPTATQNPPNPVLGICVKYRCDSCTLGAATSQRGPTG